MVDTTQLTLVANLPGQDSSLCSWRLVLGDVRRTLSNRCFKLQYTEPRHRFSAYQTRPEERCFLRAHHKYIYRRVSVCVSLPERCLDPRRLRQGGYVIKHTTTRYRSSESINKGSVGGLNARALEWPLREVTAGSSVSLIRMATRTVH